MKHLQLYEGFRENFEQTKHDYEHQLHTQRQRMLEAIKAKMKLLQVDQIFFYTLTSNELSFPVKIQGVQTTSYDLKRLFMDQAGLEIDAYTDRHDLATDCSHHNKRPLDYMETEDVLRLYELVNGFTIDNLLPRAIDADCKAGLKQFKELVFRSDVDLTAVDEYNDKYCFDVIHDVMLEGYEKFVTSYEFQKMFMVKYGEELLEGEEDTGPGSPPAPYSIRAWQLLQPFGINDQIKKEYAYLFEGEEMGFFVKA